MTKQGSIIRWDATRAFGFIRSADCAGDVFFHLRDYRGSTPPREGLTVVFEEIHVGGKGPQAAHGEDRCPRPPPGLPWPMA